MVKFILIKSPDEWATTKQACRDELVVYLFFSPIYFALLPCIEHCFTNIKFTLYIYIYIYIRTYMYIYALNNFINEEVVCIIGHIERTLLITSS